MIYYKNITNETINQKAILDLYNDVGWTNYTQNPATLTEGIKSSLCVFGAYANTELVGLIRIVGDGLTIIYIQDILVKKQYQRQKIGQQLLQLILEKYANVRQKVLMTDKQKTVIRFYEKNGFQKMVDLNLIGFVKL